MSSKRKSGGASGAAASPTATPKKSRVPPEKHEEVTEKGLGFLSFLTNAKDKGGHTISEHFLDLPSKDDFPDYYEVTPLPISLDTIQGKLERGDYPTMTKVESDLKRMVFNAKAYNEKTSEIHRDAEKIRKMVTHHMKERKLNPAYADPSYSSFPTALPGEEEDDEDQAADEGEEAVAQTDGAADTPDVNDLRPRRKLLLRGPANPTPGDSESAAISEAEGRGKTPGRQRLRLSKPSAEKERLRRQSNPAGSDSESQAPATRKIKLRAPAADKEDAAQDSSAVVSDAEIKDEAQGAKRPRLILRNQSEDKDGSRRMSSSTPITAGTADANEGFEGKSMSRAQEKIVQELLELQSEDGETHIAGPFINLPSREIKDYYQVIKHPLSLKGIMKLVRGVKGREKPTGTTLLSTWQDFEDEMSFIWNNARLYNEDDSEISQLAGELQTYFRKRVAQARAVVSDPPGTQSRRIKLHVKEPEPTPKLKLSAGVKRSAEEMSNYTVDPEALKRQKQMVSEGINGRISMPAATPAPALARENSSLSARGDRETSVNDGTTIKLQSEEPKAIQQLREAAQSANGAAAANGITLNGDLQPLVGTMMPPPTTPLGSIRPLSQPKPPPIQQPRLPWDVWRRIDRPEAFKWPYSTIHDIALTSHPTLNLGPKAYRWHFRPRPEFNYATDVLPLRKDSSRVLLAPLFTKPTTDRPIVTTCVSLNGARQHASSNNPSITDDDRPVFDLTLSMNETSEIEVQCFTQATDPTSLQDVIFDKYSLIINPRSG